MCAVPRVQRQQDIDRHRAVLRMHERARSADGIDGLRQRGDARMQHVDERELRVERLRGRAHAHPGPLVVHTNDGRRLGEREVESRQRIEVAVADVVHDLAHRPAVGAVRRVELRRGEPGHGGAQRRGKRGDGCDGGRARVVGHAGRPREAADRILQVVEIHGVRRVRVWPPAGGATRAAGASPG
jgi:hypothetical protein